MSRVSATVTAEQKAEIERRAKMHGQSVSAYLARCALPDLDGVKSVPERWWDRLGLERKWQLRNWFDEEAKKERAAAKVAGPFLPFGECEPPDVESA
jgi:hypothetical protein